MMLSGCEGNPELGSEMVTAPATQPTCVFGCSIDIEVDKMETQPNLQTFQQNKTKSKSTSSVIGTGN